MRNYEIKKGFTSKEEETKVAEYMRSLINSGCRILVEPFNVSGLWLSMASGDLGITPASETERIALKIDPKLIKQNSPYPEILEVPYQGFEGTTLYLDRPDRVSYTFYRDRKAFLAERSLHGHLKVQHEIPRLWFDKVGLIIKES